MSSPVPYRPELSNLLIKASANRTFLQKLLTDPCGTATNEKLIGRDLQIFCDEPQPTGYTKLSDFAREIKNRLIIQGP